MSVCFCPSKALSSRLLGSLTLMLLLRSSASFLVRSSGLPASAALDAARHRGGAASARALAFSSYKGRSLSASVDLGGSAVTRLDKAVDVFGEKQPKKEWDYVAHHPRYEMVRSEVVQEYGAKVTLYRHRKTQTEIMSVTVDDDNKVFGITFRTPPTDSTGLPHILEHSVLCGSRKFPVK
ncbi:hypothetical protein VYU27_009661, partial [Nannochloropsis oceanica]